jgi:hypothetical protein
MHAFVRQLLIGCMAWPHGSGHATQTRCMQCWQACACVWACAFYVLCIRTRVCVCFVCVCVYVAGWVGAVPCARERVPDTKCSFDACIRVPAAHLVDVMDTAAALLRAASVHMLSSVCRCWPPCMCLRALCVRERGHVRVHRPFEFRRPCALSSTIFALFDVPTSFTGRSGL